MIGMLTGRIAFAADDHVVIDVGGVGYVVYCTAPTLAALAPGQTATVHTDLLVREDLLQLFGFREPAEREWHRLLTRVQGVGAKVSLAILGTAGAEGVSRAIALSDPSALRAAPGVGPKLAQRIVNELKDKAPSVMAVSAGAGLPPGGAAPSMTVDAISALVNLGYTPAEAQSAAMRAAEEGAPDVQSVIRAALKALSPQG